MTSTDMDDDPLRLDRQVCFALAVANRTVIGVYRPVLAELGLTHPQYLVMLALWERCPRSIKDLSESLLLDAATLSPLLKRLEASGHITRGRSTADERLLQVELTPSGRRLRERALAVPGEVIRRLGLPLEELVAMHAQLTSVIQAGVRANERRM